MFLKWLKLTGTWWLNLERSFHQYQPCIPPLPSSNPSPGWVISLGITNPTPPHCTRFPSSSLTSFSPASRPISITETYPKIKHTPFFFKQWWMPAKAQGISYSRVQSCRAARVWVKHPGKKTRGNTDSRPLKLNASFTTQEQSGINSANKTFLLWFVEHVTAVKSWWWYIITRFWIMWGDDSD